MSIQNDQTTDKESGALSTILRLFWMAVGNFILLISLIFIFQHKGRILNSADIVYWVTVVALVLTRYLDIKHLGGQTSAGQPATFGHWIKYAIFLLIFSTTLWIIAHTVNYLVVNK
jgi:hypothetical protein